MAEILKKDPATYDRERDIFIRDLKHFCEARGTPTRRPPTINGKELDLYLLYQLVTSKGGWVKVNQRNEWGNIAKQFDHLQHCVNGEVALKQVYLRYLDRYEKINFLGETCDRNVDDDEEGRHKRFSTRVVNPVPHLYNYHQHVVPDSVRASGKLSQNLYNASEYDKLALSLISPLPNEQDFAINVCGLLSGSNNEGKSTTLKLCNHPRLLHYLLAHAAVYNHHSLRNLMEENYKEIRGYSLKYFWTDVLEDKELSILMDEKKLVKRRSKAIGGGCPDYEDIVSSDGDNHQRISSDNDVDCRLKLEPDDKELFCVGRSYGTQDFVGQRVLQVAMILRNATFIEDNVPTLARDSTFLRFVLLCCGSRWNCLHQLGFDMLSNIAHEITLEDYLVDHIFRIVCQGLESHDRAVILGCVETLNKLGQKEENEEVMLRCIEQRVYDRICSFLSLQDIMLLIHTLECLYSLSSLGEKACNSIVHVHGAIDTLVSLVTVEAQSYGPKACILMRVVETVTGDPQESDNTSFFAAPSISHSSSGSYSSMSAVTAANTSTAGSYVFPSSTMTPALTNNVPSMVVTSLPNAVTPVSTSSASLLATPVPTSSTTMPVINIRPVTPQRIMLSASSVSTTPSIVPAAATAAATAVVAAAAASASAAVTVSSTVVSTNAVASTSVTLSSHPSIVATQMENENFATQWLKNTFETHTMPGRGIEQNEMYKLYLTACSRAGRRGVIAPLHFPPCVRSVFGNNVGPRPVVPLNAASNPEATTTSKLLVYEGLQVRAKPLNVTVTPSTLTQPARTPSSPILKAQLSSPSAPTITKKEVKSKVTSSHPHLSNVLLNAGANTAVVSTPVKPAIQATTTVVSSPMVANDASNSTSLIKSLLASKVGDLMTPKTATNLKNEKTVVSTPHQLVLNTSVAAQVTQRQQQQQLQQHKIIAQPHLQAISSSGDAANVHIIQQPQELPKQMIQITQPVTQSQLVQVIQASQQGDQKPQIIQLSPAAQQQLLQVNASSDKPQIVQISHPGGQQQLIQLTPSGQQQLLQICQQASQNPQQSIIQMCSVKQEQSVQTVENVAVSQPQVILSQSSAQGPQMIQITPALQQQLLPQLPPAVQQQILQASQQGTSQVVLQSQVASSVALQSQQVTSQMAVQPQQIMQQVAVQSQQVIPQVVIQGQQQQQVSSSTTRSLLTQQLLQEQGTQSVMIQPQPPQQQMITVSGEQQFTIAPQVKQQLMSEVQSAAAPGAVVKQIQVQPSQTVATQISQNMPTPIAVQPKVDQAVQSSTVSVITSAANIKPCFSRINGMRAVNAPSVVVDDDKNNLASTLFTEEKMESSPELPSASNSNDSSDIPKASLVNQTASKVIVENHTASTVGVPFVSVKSTKCSDLDSELSESSSNQSLPVISIKDTENNLPSCEMPSEDSTGMFEDFLINGKGSNTMDETLSNNMMSEDSLLNNIIMRDEMAVSSDSVMIDSGKNEVVANNGTVLENEKSNAPDVPAISCTATPTKENDQTTDTNQSVVVGGAPSTVVAAPKKEAAAVQTDITDSQAKPCNNFSGILKTEVKSEEKSSNTVNVMTKNLMLAELLEKNSEKKEPPIVNGAVRLSEKGFELISKEELQRNMKAAFNEKTVICSNKKPFPSVNNVDSVAKPELVVGETVLPAVPNQRIVGIKRTNDQEVQCDTDAKKPHLNGDASLKCNPAGEEESHDEANVKASSSAANLYAALAADVLGDIDGMEDEEVPCVSSTPAPVPTTSFSTVTPSPSPVIESPSQQLYLAAGSNPRQILVAASSSSMAPRVVMGAGGQQYFLTPQTAIVQGQPQTVLVTQTAQQHGTGAKTIIILQSQNAPQLSAQSVAATNSAQQKVIMQKVAAGAPTAVMAATSSSVLTTQSLPNTLKGVVAQPAPLKMLQTTTQTQPSQMTATSQFAAGQPITNVFTLNGNTLAQQTPISVAAGVQCNVSAQTAVVSHMQPQITTQVSTQQVVAANGVATSVVASPMAQQLQQTAASSLGRQVKVIKTVPHLQSVISSKGTAQLHLQHPHTSVITTSTVVTDTLTTVATAGVVAPNVNVANVIPQQQNIPSQQAPVVSTVLSATTTATGTAMATPGAAAAAAAAVAAAAASANVTSSTATTAVSTPTTIVTPVRTVDLGQFLCEWRSCMRSFRTANEVYLHACAAHCPSGSQEIQCLWERCDAMKRKRFSLMTHLYDRHCNPEMLKMMAVRRRQISQSGRSEIPPPTPPTPHPGYAPNAALHAIKRHALEFVNPKELQDENEGPVTKSIRLTSSLILRNVVIYSTSGRRHLTGFEPHLAGIALSNVESSRTIAQILYDMNEHNR